MPRISAFYGIVISMNFYDHPPPHFHVTYAEHKARIDIRTLEEISGRLPPRALRLVREWAGAHQTELADNWERAAAGRSLASIKPLR